MPAVTLQNRTTHSSQNCGVRIALAAVTFAARDQRAVRGCCSGSQPSGFQPSAGSRTVNAPSVIITK